MTDTRLLNGLCSRSAGVSCALACLCLTAFAAVAGDADDTSPDTSSAKPKRSHIQPVGEVVVAARYRDTLGLRLARASEVLRQQLGLGRGVGLVVEEVTPGSPADRAGIRQHDVLVLLDDQMLLLPEQLAALLDSDADSAAECTLLRGGMRVQVPLGSRPDGERPALAAQAPPAAQGAPALQPPPPAEGAAASAVRTAAKPSPGLGLRPAAAALALVQPREQAAARGPGARPRESQADMVASFRRPQLEPPAVPRGKAAADETLVRQDPDYQIKLSRGAETRLVVIDSRGRILFNDQIDSPESRRLVPPMVKQRVEEMERALEPRPSAAYEIGRLDTPPIDLK